MSKVLVVLGATGKQGSSVINSVLSDPTAKETFALRAITRDASKPAAKALADRGVEVVVGDLGDKESLVKAFQGAYAVYAVTDYWHDLSKDKEIQQGKNIADAAKSAGIQHLVWSTLINAAKATDGKLSGIDHFDSKAEIEDYIVSLGLPASFYLPGYYMTNFPNQIIRKDESTGKYVMALPTKEAAHIPLLDVERDTGKFVVPILLDREGMLGKRILGSVAYYTPQEIIDGFARAFPQAGQGITYVTLPDEVYKKALMDSGMPDNIAEELLQNMILLNDEYGYYSGEPLDESLKRNTTDVEQIVKEPLVSWEEWLKTYSPFKDLQ